MILSGEVGREPEVRFLAKAVSKAMHLPYLDIGSGTQDVLLLDTAQPAENAIQLVPAVF